MSKALAKDLAPKYRAILTDITCIKILAKCTLKPSSVKELTSELEIPSAMCYRKVNNMVAVGLLRHTEYRGRGHRKEKVYESVLKSYTIRYSKGHVIMDMDIDDVEGPVRAVLGR